MQFTARSSRSPLPVGAGSGSARRGCFAWAAALLLTLGLLLALPLPARAADLELQEVKALRGDDGVYLSFAAHFSLPRVVEDAVLKGIPLYFVADARVYRSRWYWRDRRVASASRQWRLSYHPLMRRYRVNFGSLGQNYDSLPEALSAIHRTMVWKLAEPDRIQDGERHYVTLHYRLDLSQLPRPFQIGIEGQPDWQLQASAVVPLEDAAR